MNGIEKWVEVINLTRYSASSEGRIFDHARHVILAQTPDRAGYLRVKIHTPDGRKTASVHRLVAGSFFDFDIVGFEINHINGYKWDNHISNLEICDRSRNMIHAFTENLAQPIYPIKRVRIVETGETFGSTGQVDRHLGVSSGSVSKTLRGLQPTCAGYTFEILE